MSVTYLRTEIRRTFRNTRFVLFAIAFPVLMFLLQANLFLSGVTPAEKASAVGVVMVNMMVFGTLAASMSTGARLSVERSVGWQRQLRLTPLSGPGYLGGKGVSGMLVGLPALILVPLIAGVAEGVHLDAIGWVKIIAGIWIGSVPLVLIGLLLGQFGTPESMQPVNMLVMMGMGFLGGLWIPIDTAAWVHNVAQFLPSYWLTALVRPVVTNELNVSFGHAAMVLGGWTVVLMALVARRYRKDSARV
ncbi:MAG: transporter [Amycolatopsis sp.]|jgi:ABC-2 type transport system permease protein|uniref:ABC transporter permease n=1 Tax=Amycolatopsis sp. TaxID=37632 RepID=UPI0026042A7E|nr:ABC transporter permease [Amycolatopsis sp.]MCU1684305.1 transporter [Amycolatopsis sp.]